MGSDFDMSTQQDWLKLCGKFSGLPILEKMKMLSRLQWAASMAARGTYVPGTEEVLHPKALRRITELIHRTSQFQLDVLYGKERRSDEDFFTHVGDELGGLKFEVQHPVI